MEAESGILISFTGRDRKLFMLVQNCKKTEPEYRQNNKNEYLVLDIIMTER